MPPLSIDKGLMAAIEDIESVRRGLAQSGHEPVDTVPLRLVVEVVANIRGHRFPIEDLFRHGYLELTPDPELVRVTAKRLPPVGHGRDAVRIDDRLTRTLIRRWSAGDRNFLPPPVIDLRPQLPGGRARPEGSDESFKSALRKEDARPVLVARAKPTPRSRPPERTYSIRGAPPAARSPPAPEVVKTPPPAPAKPELPADGTPEAAELALVLTWIARTSGNGDLPPSTCMRIITLAAPRRDHQWLTEMMELGLLAKENSPRDGVKIRLTKKAKDWLVTQPRVDISAADRASLDRRSQY